MTLGEAAGRTRIFAISGCRAGDRGVEERKCPICATVFLNAPRLTGGRPKRYCGSACRREAEFRVRRERQAERHRAYLASLPARVRELYEAVPSSAELGELLNIPSSKEFAKLVGLAPDDDDEER